MTGRSYIKRNLRQSAGDVRQILRLVEEAEKLPWPDKKELGDVYAVAMNAIGPLPLQTAPEEYGELCVKRLLVLCHVDPQEARTFNSFLAFYGIRQDDPRLQQALHTTRDSLASVVLGSPPRRGEKERVAAEGSRCSFTPLRPRNLSYSSCDTTKLEEAIAAVAANAFAEKEGQRNDSEHVQAVAVPPPPRKMELLSCPENNERQEARREFPRVSTALDLSPIPEDREKAAEAPRGTGADFVAEADGQGMSKVVIVNGVSYTRLQTIGRGGTSKVYQVRSPSGRLLALKRVTASCPKHFEALANEVTLLMQLKECPNIIQVLDAEVLPERLLIHIVMEEGQMDLGRLLQSQSEMSLGDVQALWKQMLEAVQVVHQERVVHSDLKPGNFLLVKQRLKLIDFGIAKRIASNTTNISRESSVGTISYMAPEAVKQGAVKIGRPSDVWSLGIILYQMVYMRAPFAHLDPMQRLFALTDPSVSVEFSESHRFEKHSESVKATLLDVLQRCLQRDPSQRPAIPELLAHPFVQQEDLRLSRASFDRTLEVLLKGFVSAASNVLKTGASESTAALCEEGPAICWQALADEVWQRLKDGPNQETDGGDGSQNFTKQLEPFREWLARGFKRQRVATGTAQASHNGKSQGHQPMPSSAPRSTSATRTGARVPLHQINHHAAANSKVDRPAIQAELLQKQRTCLRKAPGAPPRSHVGKENMNMGPKNTTAGFAADNLVLKRLKDRRAMVEDKEDETDTCWGR